MAESSDESGDEVEESEKSSGHERSIARRIKKQRVSIDKDECCINRIDKLNEKIANLSGCLDNFSPSNIHSGLVFNKHASKDPFMENSFDDDNEEIENELKNIKSASISTMKKGLQAQNSKDLEKFAGLYSFKMVLTPSGPNLSQDSSSKTLKKMKSKLGMSNSSVNLTKRPMLVELHSFPGYDRDMITALPSPLQPVDVFEIVTSAQLDLERKPTFRREFKRFFFSSLSQAILSDTFWWFFCDKYQPTPNSQEKLFNRIAHNYTKFLVRWNGSKYKDTLFKRFPDILAQSVYTTFCQAFPTSYRQFDDKFKDDLIYLVNQWITGTRPAPQTFTNWNLTGLEPKDMRKGDQLYLDASNKSKKAGVDRPLNDDPFSHMNQTDPGKINSSSQNGTQTRSRKISRTIGQAASTHASIHLPTINEPDRTKGAFHKEKMDLSPTGQSSSRLFGGKENANGKRMDESGMEINNNTSLQQMSSIQLMPKIKTKKESCKAGRGPEFSKNVFDIYGRSPLIEQFLCSNNLSSDGGIGMLVRRTEIDKLPSSSPSYNDVIRGTQKSSKMVKSQYRRSIEENATERTKIAKKQIQIQREMERRTEELMANPNQVKKISDLLRLSLLRDQRDDFELSPADVVAELSKALEYGIMDQTK